MPATNDQSAPSAAEALLDDQRVRDYLKRNADFLQRNPDLLDNLQITHASGSATSLVEKQVGVLRDRNVELRHKLTDLTANARNNDALLANTRRLVLGLLDASSIADLHTAYTNSMGQDFKVEYASLILFSDDDPQPEMGNCRLERISDAELKIGALLKARNAVCGPLRKDELTYLFPGTGGVGSAAVMLLKTEHTLGLIAVGSSDANYYDSNMGTQFLSHIAEVVVRLLPRLWPQ